MTTYLEKLRDPRWQRRRLEILGRANFSCEICEATERTLHVHHKLYRKGAMPWDYADDELIALCESCHESQHEWRARLDAAIAECHPGALEQVVGFAEAIAAENYIFPDGDKVSPVRVWKLSSYEHALGFYLALQSVPEVTAVDNLIAKHQELTEQQVFEYLRDGLRDG